MWVLKHTLFKSVLERVKRTLPFRLLNPYDQPNGTELAQYILWCICVIWCIPIWLYPSRFLALQNYTELHSHIRLPVLQVLLLVLVIGPWVIDFVLRRKSRTRTILFISIAIIRSGFFSFCAAFIYVAVPFGISAATHALFALLSLWVVWRLSDGLYR